MEYQWLPHRLKFNGAICLESLSSEEVSKYLASGGSKLAALRKAVNTDSVLQELAQTPLMLSIMSLACQGVGGDELARQEGDSPEERRKQIFRLYVERMFQRKDSAAVVFPKEKIINWLSWLAKRMRKHSQSVFMVEGLQPSWLGSRSQRGAYGSFVALSLGLIGGLTVGLIFALAFGFLHGLREDLNAGLIFGLGFGLIFGLLIFLGVGLGCWSESPLKNGVVSGSIGFLGLGLFGGGPILLMGGLFVGLMGGLAAGSLKRISLVETISWNWSQFWKRTIPGSIAGLIVGSIFGPIYLSFELRRELNAELRAELSEGLMFMLAALIYALISGLLYGLVNGLIGGFTDRVKVGKVFPNQGIKSSRKNLFAVFLVTWLAVGLVVCLIDGLIYGLSESLSESLIYGLHHGLIFGPYSGLLVGLNRGGSAVVKHYALRLTLSLNRYTPFKIVQFLDECNRLILLKKVGGGYIFIHRMLLEYFAGLPPPNPEKLRIGSGGEMRRGSQVGLISTH